MNRLLLLLLLALIAYAGCATYKEYTCPPPIGAIVQDNCDAFRVRYDSARLDIGFSLGGVGAHVRAGTEKVRDPSEMIQLIAQRTLSLCHDYNTCRLTNGEYRARRDEADQLLTAIFAITGQLKNQSLDPSSREKLVARLLALLETGRPTDSRPAAPPQPTPAATARTYRRASQVYARAVVAPPRPAQLARGVPDVIDAVAWPPPGLGKLSGIHVTLGGRAPDDVQADDVLELEAGGTRVACPVRRAFPSQATDFAGVAECPAEKLATPLGALTVWYRPGVSGRLTRLGSVDLGAAWFFRRAWIAFTAEPVGLSPVLFERPYLVVYTEHDAERRAVFARCRVNGNPVGGVLRATDDAVSALWRRFHVALPFSVRVAEGAAVPAPDDLFEAARHAGRWSCSLTLNGNPLREVEFDVQKNARIAGLAADGGSAFAPPWWPVRVRVD